LEGQMSTGLGLSDFVVSALTTLINAALAASGWDLGIPRCNEDFVWQ